MKKILLGAGLVLGGAIAGIGIYAGSKVSAFNASMDHVYDIPVPSLSRSSDPAVLARGKHLAESVGACATADCHGTDLGGGKTLDMGPLGTLAGPNLSNGLLTAYSDGELARLIQYGVKRDGRSVRLMPVQDFNWLPQADLVAMISYLRSIPAVDRPNGKTEVKPLAKILDRRNEIIFDVARRTSVAKLDTAPAPSPTADYGRFLARLCMGCHGEGLGGGRIPGAPPSLPIPSNITPHETGLAGWTYEDFLTLLNTGRRKNGLALNPFMPYEAWAKFDDVEKKALWAYLQTVPPRPFGQR
ncbi:MAG TPA: cytochrome c [Pseudomonadota bacterium]|nr:cytochrome c [Pseudomonadota bacterium]